jgi:hypothetical protein
MQKIIDKYDTMGSSYLLPIILDAEADERKQYKNAAQLVNSKLKKLGEQIGLPIPLTSYVARHAWLLSPEVKTFRWLPSARLWDMIRKTLHGFILHR